MAQEFKQKRPELLRDLGAVASYDLFQWPEWRALLDRLGVPAELRTTRIVIDSGGVDDLVTVAHYHQAVDASPENRAAIETTNVHNRHYATWMPNPRQAPECDCPGVPHPDKLL
jgi:hypothetical protein